MKEDPEDVHPRRRVLRYSRATLDNLEYEVKPGQYHRGVYEKRYGVPADPDKVWADRQLAQDMKDLSL